MKKNETNVYLKEYLDDCLLRKRLSEKTLSAYKIDLKQFFDFIDQSYVDDFKKINEYILYLNQRYTKHKTIKRKIASVKAFYMYLEYREVIEFSPFKKIRTKIKEPKVLPKIIQKEYLEIIFQWLVVNLESANTEYKKRIALRNLTIIELLFSTGIRISELCHLKVEDINFQERLLKIFGKGSKERIIYIGNDDVMNLLKLLIKYNKNNKYLFLNKFNKQLSEQSVRILLTTIEKEKGLSTHITPHMFRHTFATTLLEKEVDIRYIQNILGHSSISTTQIYTHVNSLKQKEILTNKNPMNDYKEINWKSI